MSEQTTNRSNDRNEEKRLITRRDFLRKSALAASGLAAATLAACAPPAAPAAPAATSAPAAAPGATQAPAAVAATSAPAVNKGATINLKYRTWWMTEGTRGPTWKKLIDTFNASQKDIQVTAENGDFNAYTNKVVIELGSGKVDGDLLQTTPDLAPRLLKAGILTPLDDVLTANNIKEISKSHDYIRQNGHIYGLDMVTVAFGLLYNQAVLDKAGVKDLPTDVNSWVDFTKRLTSKPNTFGIFSTHTLKEPEGFWFILQDWIMPYDGRWADGKKPLVTSAPVINGMKLFKTMYDNAMPQGTDSGTADRLFGNGQIAQYLRESAAVGQLLTTSPQLKPTLKSMAPPWPSKRAISRIHPLTVNAQSPNKQAAVQFVTWLYKPENYRQIVEGSQDVIFSQPAAADPAYLASLPWLTPGYSDINPISPPEVMGDFIYNNQEFGQVVITHLSNALTANKPIEDEMAQAQKELEALATRLSA